MSELSLEVLAADLLIAMCSNPALDPGKLDLPLMALLHALSLRRLCANSPKPSYVYVHPPPRRTQ